MSASVPAKGGSHGMQGDLRPSSDFPRDRPWRVNTARYGDLTVRTDNDFVVCTVEDWSCAADHARLIAAAPDLLSSLTEVCDWISGCLAADDDSMPAPDMLRETERLASAARAAIAKATGAA